MKQKWLVTVVCTIYTEGVLFLKPGTTEDTTVSVVIELPLDRDPVDWFLANQPKSTNDVIEGRLKALIGFWKINQ